MFVTRMASKAGRCFSFPLLLFYTDGMSFFRDPGTPFYLSLADLFGGYKRHSSGTSILGNGVLQKRARSPSQRRSWNTARHNGVVLPNVMTCPGSWWTEKVVLLDNIPSQSWTFVWTREGNDILEFSRYPKGVDFERAIHVGTPTEEVIALFSVTWDIENDCHFSVHQEPELTCGV
jgi:hypothetical protein